ncbi:ion transporter [bacterium]|nr:ion transporter [bacterium]
MNKGKTVKRRVFEIISCARVGDVVSKIFDISIITLIVLNALALVLETVDSLATLTQYFRIFEIVSVVIFSIEYLLRIWTCSYIDTKYKGVIGKIRYILSFYALVDLMAILPFYLPFLIKIDLRFLRLFRILRIVRIMKLGRYSTALKVISKVFSKKKEELIISISIMVFLIFISSRMMYYMEHTHQPETFSSIPESMWWAVATITTVGYGDVYPITPIGKFCASIIALLGIGMFALPTGIIASGFNEVILKSKKKIKCPHCGKDI